MAASAGDGGRGDALGLDLAPLDQRARARLGLDPDVQGAVVTAVKPGSAAARQGLRPGDVITRIGQSGVDSPDGIAEALASARKRGADSVLALVRRGDTQRFVALEIGQG